MVGAEGGEGGGGLLARVAWWRAWLWGEMMTLPVNWGMALGGGGAGLALVGMGPWVGVVGVVGVFLLGLWGQGWSGRPLLGFCPALFPLLGRLCLGH